MVKLLFHCTYSVQRQTVTAPEVQLLVFHHVVKKKLSKHLMFQFYPVESKIKFSIRISNPQFSACFLPWRRPLSPAVEILTSQANLTRVLMFFVHLPFFIILVEAAFAVCINCVHS